MTLSLACSNSSIATDRLPRRAAISAGLVDEIGEIGAEKPGVPRG